MIKHEKRYMIILEVWNAPNMQNVTPNISYSQYNDMKDVNDDINMIIDMYLNVKAPSPYIPNSFYWGYVVLDFKNEKILSMGHDILRKYYNNRSMCKDKSSKEYLEMMDDFFRKDNEIPKNYKWQPGEYIGWLQFRWGNKKNAVKYDKSGQKLEVKASDIMEDPYLKIL